MKKRKVCERPADVSKEDLRVRSLWSLACLGSSIFVVSFLSFRRSRGGRAPLFWKSWPRLEGVVSPFFSGEPVGRKNRNWFWCIHLFVSRTSTGDGCPRASDVKRFFFFESDSSEHVLTNLERSEHVGASRQGGDLEYVHERLHVA